MPREFLGPHLECVRVSRRGKDLCEVVMAHLPPRPDEVDYHGAVFVYRDEEVPGRASGRPCALQPDVAAGLYGNFFRPDPKIVTSEAERQTGVKPAFIPDEQRHPANHSVPVCFQTEKPYP